MKNKNINEGTSDFLKKLHTAVSTGDATKGLDAIQKINEIHKLADSMDGEIAASKFDKRVEDAGVKDVLTPEERKTISVESEREKIKREEEELKFKMIADIQNSEYDIKATNKELEEIQLQYKKVIEAQEEQLNVLKIKYEAKFGEEYDG